MQYVLSFILLWASIENIQGQDTAIDSLEKLIASASNDSIKVYHYLELTSKTIDSDLDRCWKYGRKAYGLAQTAHLPLAIVECHNLFGNLLQRQGKADSAMVWYEQALTKAKKLGYKKGMAKTYNNIAIIHTYAAEYEKALMLYQEGIKVEEELGNMVGVAQGYNNMAVVYYQTRNFDNTLEYLKKAGEVLELSKDDATLKKTYVNIGAIHSYLGQEKEALDYYLKAYEISERLGDRREMAICLGNMSDCYLNLGQFDKAEDCLNKAIAIKTQDKNEMGLMHEYANLARLFDAKGDRDKAEEHYDLAVKTARKFKMKAELRDLYRIYSQSLLGWERGDDAYAMLELSYKYNDSLVNEQTAKALAELETKYETEKKERTILQQENLLAESKLDLMVQRRWLLALGLGFAVVIMLALLLAQRWRARLRAERDAAIILEREEGIKAIFEATDNERKRIAADLHDGIGQQMSGLRLAFAKLGTDLKAKEPNFTTRIDSLTAVLDDTCQEVRQISHEMMPKSLSENGLISALEDMLAKSLKFSDMEYQFEHQGIDARLPEHLELSLFRVCQELINNVVKHSKATQVNVQLYKLKEYLVMLVEDNGKGMDDNARRQEGIGLKTLASRVNSINGELNFEPSPSAGTVATVRVPL